MTGHSAVGTNIQTLVSMTPKQEPLLLLLLSHFSRVRLYATP